GVQADIGIRGGSFEQTLVMVNGIKVNDPQTGHHNLNVPFNILDIDQAEIVKGPGARLYGQNAFSGAVNFITRVRESRGVRAQLFGGGFGLRGGSLSLSIPAGAYRQSLAFSGSRSDGYRENTDFSILNALYTSSVRAGRGDLNFLGGYVSRKFGANGFYANPSFTRQYEAVETAMAGVGYSLQTKNFTWHPRVYFRINTDDYLFIREDPSVYKNLHTTHVAGAELNSSWKTRLGTTGMGFEYRLESIRGTWVRSGIETKSNLDGFSRNHIGLFLEHRFVFGRLDLTPGVYSGYYSDFGIKTFPGIDAGFSFGRNFRVYANFGQSFRIPSFYDQHYDSPVEKGDPELDPESSTGFEAGLKFQTGSISSEFNIFRQNSSNLIDWVRVPLSDSTYYWQARNITEIARTGVEFGMKFVPRTSRSMPDKSWLPTIGFTYNYLISDLADNGIISRYILENLKHQLIMGIEHRIAWKIFHHMNIRYNVRESEPEYWVIDSRIFWRHKEIPLIFVEATNLTDTRYTEVMTPMPGRWFRCGIQYNFGF
ncbi:MAG TPA: TonB-dependent receptor, partial [Cyclobacteriaceae bacterium]|nr:TonB-dependent receptor [Cyclobacteriaceae bacterium]